jgi:glycosyltransferase involved in cell wall biosynthesis
MANQTQQLAHLLSAEGCQVTLVRNNAPYRPNWIAVVRGVRAVFRIVPYVRALWRATRGGEIVHVMANSGLAWHLFGAPAIWIASLRKIPVVVNYRGGNAEAFLLREIVFVRPTLARAAVVVVPSEFLARVFARHSISTVIVPNIVNLESFRPAPELPATPHLIVTRNLEAIYDIPTAIRAFALVRIQCPNARLTIVGSGPERMVLEELARQLGVADGIRFSGRVENSDLPAIYRSASVVVNPSHIDNMPISLLEALASGVPVVSTNVGGVPYLVEHERTALLVFPSQPEAMAAAIIRLQREPAVAHRLRAAGLERVVEYAWPQVRPQLFRAYAQAKARHRAAMAGS